MEITDLSDQESTGDAREIRSVAETIRGGLIAFNGSVRPDPAAAPMTLVMKDDGGRVVAGMLGRTAYGWLRIDVVWVTEEMRGGGLGRELVVHAERLAIDRGCHSVHLDTYGFQAPDFYERLGYREFGRLERYPDQDVHKFFRKSLT